MKIVDYRANRIGTSKTLEKFRHLWKLNDSNWVEERRHQAKLLTKMPALIGDSAQSVKKSTKYFCNGELTDYISIPLKFFLTPVDSSETAKQVFESQLFDKSQRKQLFGSYATLSHQYCPQMPWLQDHILYFIKGVLGDSYVEIREEGGRRPYRISPAPSSWCRRYIDSTIKLFKQQDGYYGAIDCLPYFISALPHVDDSGIRSEVDLALMLDLAETVSTQEDGMPQAKKLAREILDHRTEINDAWAVNAHLDSSD